MSLIISVIGIYDSNKNETKVTTGSDGTVSIKLKPGVYQYQEIVAPKGYELNNTIYSFTVAKDGTVTFNTANGIIYDKKKEEKPDIPTEPEKPDTPDEPKGNVIIPIENTIVQKTIKEQPENMVNGRLPQTGETEGTIIVVAIIAISGIYFETKIRNKE